MPGTTAEKLNKVLQTKKEIREAMLGKLMDVPVDTPFGQYPDIIANHKLKTSELINNGSGTTEGENYFIGKVAFDEALALKADKSVLESDYALKSAVEAVDAKFANYTLTSVLEKDYALKSEVTAVDGKFADYTTTEVLARDYALKSEVTAVDNKFANYTTTEDLNIALGKKADTTAVDNKFKDYTTTVDLNKALDLKANQSALETVDAKFANYTDTKALDGKLALKADQSALEETNAQVALKAVKTEVDEALKLKADQSALEVVDGKFADYTKTSELGNTYYTESEIDDKLALKADKASTTSKGTATLPVYFDAQGVAQTITSYEGKSATAGTADEAVKLQTARTIALTGDVTGTVDFDGTGNVEIATTVVNAGNYLDKTTGGVVNGEVSADKLKFKAVDRDAFGLTESPEVLYVDVESEFKNIKSTMSGIPKFAIEVVDELPDGVQKPINEATIYLVKSGDGSQNLYDEFIRVNDAWELLGTQATDLKDYYKKSETYSQAEVNAKETALNTAIGKKADQTALEATNAQVALKADQTAVDSALALKADQTYVEQVEADFNKSIGDINSILDAINGEVI